MKISRAMVFANERKGIAKKVMREVVSFLRSRGIGIGAGSPQVIITIGGDGTVLYNKEHYGAPFFSIGSNTSFICQADFSDWRGKLARALSELKTVKKLLLECEIDGKKMPLALNEIGIRNPQPRVLSMHLAAGKQHHAFRADGILFCTPTGSPAYCYSCGGSEMKSGEWRYQAVAISPFRRLFSPTIMRAGVECTLRISGNERAQFFVDGQEFGNFTSKNTLKVRLAKTPFLFVKI
jgi:NAD+ kinase